MVDDDVDDGDDDDGRWPLDLSVYLEDTSILIVPCMQAEDRLLISTRKVFRS